MHSRVAGTNRAALALDACTSRVLVERHDAILFIVCDKEVRESIAICVADSDVEGAVEAILRLRPERAS